MPGHEENKKDSQQILVEIGNLLREKREEKKLTLEMVQEETKIRRYYLQALENGQHDILPGEVYLKGFLKNYACFLGLPGDELVKRYSEGAKTEDVVFTSTKSRSLWSSPIQPRLKRQTILVVVLLALLTVTVVVLIKGLLPFGDFEDQLETPEMADPIIPERLPGISDDETISEVPLINLDKVKETEAEIIYQVNDSPSVELHLTADRCWTAIRIDDSAELTETLTQGSTRTLTGTDTIWLRAGNPQVLDLTINGIHVGAAGKAGQPRNIIVERQ